MPGAGYKPKVTKEATQIRKNNCAKIMRRETIGVRKKLDFKKRKEALILKYNRIMAKYKVENDWAWLLSNEGNEAGEFAYERDVELGIIQRDKARKAPEESEDEGF